MVRIGIVANEPSGDQLGAGLIRELTARYPDIRFEGVGGPLMEALGCKSLHPMDRLSVMGLTEVIKHLPELLRIRRQLAKHFISDPPGLFIGIDAPDFNLGLELVLKQAGIPTVHYVSPTVWAWRPKRVNKIRRAADLVLSIFPFEVEFLKRHRVPVSYVGHPLADEISLESSMDEARERLGIDPEKKVIALLPGSRMSEIRSLSESFLGAAERCLEQESECCFLVPLVSGQTREAFESIWRSMAPDLPLLILPGQAREAMQAADVVLTASGTATLEALLLKRPMVVAYRLSPVTYWIVKRFDMVKIPHIAMANLLAGQEIAPEFIQDAVTPEALADAVLELLASPERTDGIRQICEQVHRDLRRDSSRQAAEAVINLLESNHDPK
ncbi:MAG: lipid-A-disaccharide synthase [Gammaproteobacteria bacterium]|nr:lipid-A-disaccharide synthase [Gammaproteobacteria bacterium]